MKEGTASLALGRVVATVNAVNALPYHEIVSAISRHASGDWGEVCDQDREMNDWGLAVGERVLSAYSTPAGTRFWIITEHDRSTTTVLLPEDY